MKHPFGGSGFEPRTRASALLRLLTLDEPLTFPLDLVWRDQTGTLRRPLEAVLSTSRDVRQQHSWC